MSIDAPLAASSLLRVNIYGEAEAEAAGRDAMGCTASSANRRDNSGSEGLTLRPEGARIPPPWSLDSQREIHATSHRDFEMGILGGYVKR